jgi:hypothetical protein
MRQSEPEAYRSAIVLQLQRVALKMKRLREAFHNLGDVIERIGELLRRRPVAVSESRIVGRNQMKSIAEPREQCSNIRDEDGKPCSIKMTGASFGPASR